MNKILLFALAVLCFQDVCSQNQLVLIKNDEVVIRYTIGDDFVYKRKSRTSSTIGFIVSINDSTIITSNDTVATHQIERVYFSKGSLLNILGGGMVAAGVGIFLIDQINTILIDGKDPSLDNTVTKISLTSLAIGLPMMLITKKSHRVGFKQRLRIINRESPFYYSESRFQPKGYISPHIPRN